jgi:hypothetical protein
LKRLVLVVLHERPDSRPNLRENVKILGNLARDFDFDFDQKPRPPYLLPLHPPFS